MIGYTIIDMADGVENVCGRCGRDTLWDDDGRAGGQVCGVCGYEEIDNIYW